MEVVRDIYKKKVGRRPNKKRAKLIPPNATDSSDNLDQWCSVLESHLSKKSPGKSREASPPQTLSSNKLKGTIGTPNSQIHPPPDPEVPSISSDTPFSFSKYPLPRAFSSHRAPLEELTSSELQHQIDEQHQNAWRKITREQWIDIFGGYFSFPSKISFIESSAERLAHNCSSECRFYSKYDVYVCLKSGNVHLCTPDGCDQIQINSKGAQICGLTGLHHGIQFDMGMNTSNLSNTRISQKFYGQWVSKNGINTENSNVVTNGDRRRNRQRASTIEADFASVAPTMKRQVEMMKDCKHIITQLIFSRAREMVNLHRVRQANLSLKKDLKRYLLECRKKNSLILMKNLIEFQAAYESFIRIHNAQAKIDPKRCEPLSLLLYQISVFYWNQMKKLPLAKERKYRFGYHVMALLIFSPAGIQSEIGLYVLPPWPELQSLLPSVKDLAKLELKSSLYTKNRSFTRAEETFKQLLNELYQQGTLEHPLFHPGIEFVRDQKWILNQENRN